MITENNNDLGILDSDKEFAIAYSKIRYNIMSYFERTGVLESIKLKIDESLIFNFLSERSRKFINIKQPVFNLIINLEEAVKQYSDGVAIIGSHASDDAIINFKIEVLMREIVHPVLTELAEIFKQGEINDILTEVPEFNDDIGRDFIISSIFKIEASPSKEKNTEIMLKIFTL